MHRVLRHIIYIYIEKYLCTLAQKQKRDNNFDRISGQILL